MAPFHSLPVAVRFKMMDPGFIPPDNLTGSIILVRKEISIDCSLLLNVHQSAVLELMTVLPPI